MVFSPKKLWFRLCLNPSFFRAENHLSYYQIKNEYAAYKFGSVLKDPNKAIFYREPSDRIRLYVFDSNTAETKELDLKNIIESENLYDHLRVKVGGELVMWHFFSGTNKIAFRNAEHTRLRVVDITPYLPY